MLYQICIQLFIFKNRHLQNICDYFHAVTVDVDVGRYNDEYGNYNQSVFALETRGIIGH